MPDPVEDDTSILSENSLWRRIRPDQLVKDDNIGRIRPSSSAFSDSSNGSGMSVSLGDDATANGVTAKDLLEAYPTQFMAAITVAVARSNLQGVVRKPVDDDPYHAEVIGKKTNSVKRNFSRLAIWVVGPPADFEVP